ncbi:hypothetical protein PCE1_004172 [Barthelona sp. PCE]
MLLDKNTRIIEDLFQAVVENANIILDISLLESLTNTTVKPRFAYKKHCSSEETVLAGLFNIETLKAAFLLGLGAAVQHNKLPRLTLIEFCVDLYNSGFVPAYFMNNNEIQCDFPCPGSFVVDREGNMCSIDEMLPEGVLFDGKDVRLVIDAGYIAKAQLLVKYSVLASMVSVMEGLVAYKMDKEAVNSGVLDYNAFPGMTRASMATTLGNISCALDSTKQVTPKSKNRIDGLSGLLEHIGVLRSKLASIRPGLRIDVNSCTGTSAFATSDVFMLDAIPLFELSRLMTGEEFLGSTDFGSEELYAFFFELLSFAYNDFDKIMSGLAEKQAIAIEKKRTATIQRVATLREEGKDDLAAKIEQSLSKPQKEKRLWQISVHVERFMCSLKKIIEKGTVTFRDLVALSSDLQTVFDNDQQAKRPKIPKGTRDFGPEQMSIRNYAMKRIAETFEKHGAVPIDTPVFELRKTLLGKYGEEGAKLIYNLEDQGGELCSLRYDLTVPFARYCALTSTSRIKRYHIAKVYRRDQPNMSKGRYREFYQCDLDIAGKYAPMVPDAEILVMADEVLSDLPIGEFWIKVSHRMVLQRAVELCGVPSSKFAAVCASIDKLDKEPWESVKDELINERGLTEEVCSWLERFAAVTGTHESVISQLKEIELAEGRLYDDEAGRKAVDELELLMQYIICMRPTANIRLDMSLARGLSYYTGPIFEAVSATGLVGSIGGGGRYDGLIGMFGTKEIPSVGFSVGIERVFTLIEHNMKLRTKQTRVYVTQAGKSTKYDFLMKRMWVTGLLWEAGIASEFTQVKNSKTKDDMTTATKMGCDVVIIVGETELDNGTISIKNLLTREQVEVEICSFVDVVSEMLASNEQNPEYANLAFE